MGGEGLGKSELELESELVERAKHSQEAFHQLYDRHLPGLYRYAYYRTGQRTQAEDVVAQAFFLAWRALPRYQQRGIPFRHWLYRIAGNVLAKSHGRQPDRLLNWEEPSQPGSVETDQVELRLDLQEHLRHLPDSQQQVLVLRYLEDLSLQEVARIVGKTEGAVKQLAWRGLSTLRERMGGYAAELGE